MVFSSKWIQSLDVWVKCKWNALVEKTFGFFTCLFNSLVLNDRCRCHGCRTTGFGPTIYVEPELDAEQGETPLVSSSSLLLQHLSFLFIRGLTADSRVMSPSPSCCYRLTTSSVFTSGVLNLNEQRAIASTSISLEGHIDTFFWPNTWHNSCFSLYNLKHAVRAVHISLKLRLPMH